MTRTKLASVGFVAAHICVRRQVLDDATSFYLTVAGRSPQRHATFRNGMRLFLRTTPYYKVLKSNSLCCKVLQSTTLRYKVLVQYCKVLFHTTKYYSCTTLYYNVLLQYIILCTTKYYSILQSTTLYYKELLRATKYCSILLCEPGHILYETLFTMRGTTEATLQRHQKVRLPRKITFMIDPGHI